MSRNWVNPGWFRMFHSSAKSIRRFWCLNIMSSQKISPLLTRRSLITTRRILINRESLWVTLLINNLKNQRNLRQGSVMHTMVCTKIWHLVKTLNVVTNTNVTIAKGTTRNRLVKKTSCEEGFLLQPPTEVLSIFTEHIFAYYNVDHRVIPLRSWS